MDGQWKYHAIRDATSGCESPQIGAHISSLETFQISNMFFVKMIGMTSGLRYMHNLGIIHGKIYPVRCTVHDLTSAVH